MASNFFFKRSAKSRPVPDLDSSAEIIDDTPDPSPLPSKPKSVARISDSGISDDTGTKSKSVTPEERYRSPQVILDSDEEEEEVANNDTELQRNEIVF